MSELTKRLVPVQVRGRPVMALGRGIFQVNNEGWSSEQRSGELKLKEEPAKPKKRG